jgi:ribonuclease R
MHFGLGFDRYTHFTSTIRRYADLLVHRRLKQLMRGERGEPDRKRLAKICAEISKAERSAEAAEREMMDFHKAVFMKKRIGKRFAGHVSGVTAFGVFIELDEVFVEGMVPLALMTDDYYSFLPEIHAVLGGRTGRQLRLGDPVSVRIEDVDLGQRRATFQLLSGGSRVEGTEESGIRRRGRLRGMRRPAKARESTSPKALTKGDKTLKRNRIGLIKRARRK